MQLTVNSLGLVTVSDAMRKLRVTRTHVHRLIKSGTLDSARVGQTCVVTQVSLDEYMKNPRRKAGRPRKENAA
jgi:excisionase family DNA binding protein